MIQRGQHVRLTLEPFHPVAIRCELGGQEFQRDIAIQLSIGGPIHLTQSSNANQRQNVEVAESAAGFQRHVAGIIS